jgi:hypothetical protein
MPDQALARRHATLPAPVQQEPAGGIARHTQSQLAQMRGVIGTAVVEMDKTHAQVEAYLNQGGRSYHQQKRLAERATNLLNSYDYHVYYIVQGAFNDIRSNRTQPRETVRYITVPQRGIIPRLFGS